MHIVEQLLNTAVQDNRLLIKNQQLGDRAQVPRDIEFLLYAKNEERAKLVASFITDNRYGKPSVEQVDYKGEVLWHILVIIHAPATENVVHTFSAFMVFLAKLYDLDYDCWGSIIQNQ